MRLPVIVGVVSGHVVVIGGGRVTSVIRRFTDGRNDRCEPFTWPKPAGEILAKASVMKRH